MNDKRDPLGPGGGDRTVFQPNPGLRRPQRPGPSPAAPTRGPSPPTAPAYPPIQPDFGLTGDAPRPAEHPYGPFATARHPKDPAPDAWFRGPAPQPGPAPLKRAEDLIFDDLVTQHTNPIMRAAGPLLHLLGRLRIAALSVELGSLLEQVAAAIEFFDKEIRKAGAPAEQANVAKYLICATTDDIVQNIPADDRHLFVRHNMQARFFREQHGGVNFFMYLDMMQRNPTANFDVLELQHACLALGFQGQYRAGEGGPNQLQHIQRNLYELLRRVRPKQTLDVSPRWKGQNLPLRRKGFALPPWVAAAVAALALLAVFLGLRAAVGNSGDAVAEAIGTLHPSTAVALQAQTRPYVPPPPPPPPPPCKRLGQALGDVATVDCPVGPWVKAKIKGDILFDPGKADVRPQFWPDLEKIASVVDGEVGPIKVVGHTDNRKLKTTIPFADNTALSKARAATVARVLGDRMKDPSRLTAEGRGEWDPVSHENNETGWSLNRRVEVWITKPAD